MRSEIERRVQEALQSPAFVQLVVDKAVDYHCRKGIRRWCSCSYCETKRNGTAVIGNAASFPWTHSKLFFIYEDAEDRVRAWRDSKRRELRIRLEQEKQK